MVCIPFCLASIDIKVVRPGFYEPEKVFKTPSPPHTHTHTHTKKLILPGPRLRPGKEKKKPTKNQQLSGYLNVTVIINTEWFRIQQQ